MRRHPTPSTLNPSFFGCPGSFGSRSGIFFPKDHRAAVIVTGRPITNRPADDKGPVSIPCILLRWHRCRARQAAATRCKWNLWSHPISTRPLHRCSRELASPSHRQQKCMSFVVHRNSISIPSHRHCVSQRLSHQCFLHARGDRWDCLLNLRLEFFRFLVDLPKALQQN